MFQCVKTLTNLPTMLGGRAKERINNMNTKLLPNVANVQGD